MCLGLLAAAGLAGCALRVGRPSLPAPVSDLPLIEIQPAPAAMRQNDDTLAIMLSGDGGWAGLDKAIGKRLAGAGIPVVGWSSLRYYLRRRSPEEAADDLARTMDYYRRAWHRPRVLLIGYSRGADVLPAIYNRLPPASRAQVRQIVLLGLASHITFGYSPLSWLGLAWAARDGLSYRKCAGCPLRL